jgi:hypothetical protein
MIAGVSVALSAIVAFLALQPESAALAAVETFPDLGQIHIDANAPTPEYNSNPPTSGPHAATPASCGIYRQEVPDALAVHSLEHGAVIVQYDPATSASTRSEIESFARDAGSHIIVAPRESLDGEIAATAWTKKLTLDESLEGLDAFYFRYARNGPERGVACPVEVDEGEDG